MDQDFGHSTDSFSVQRGLPTTRTTLVVRPAGPTTNTARLSPQ